MAEHCTADAVSTALFDTTVVRAVGVRPAAEVTGAVGTRRYLHAGPPLGVDAVTGPSRGALIGALLFEEEAADAAEAAAILDAGILELVSLHSVGGVGAVTGIVTPSMPVVVVEDHTGATSFAPINEGLGRVLRFGAYEGRTIERLRWLRDIARPILDETLARLGGVDVTELQAEGLRRGDECHNRNVASTANLCLRLVPAMLSGDAPREDIVDVVRFVSGNPHFFLSFSIATAKRIADVVQMMAPHGLVTAITGNGREFGIRVSGIHDRWFLTESPIGTPKLFDGYRLEDANPVCGDSAITETVGLGAFALSAAPAISEFIGGDPRAAHALVDELRTICRGESARFLVPADGFRGTPVGIDVTAVAASGCTPLVNLGVAHREPGIGQIGAGILRLPLEPFAEAARALATVPEAVGT